jgi:FAD/FMN-containing dehydrogenase
VKLTRRELIEASAAAATALALPLEAPAQVPGRRLRELRRAVRGRVLAPGDGGYDRARLLFNTRFDGIRPPAVVQVRDIADVQAVVRWAGRHDVPLVVRSGGNAYNGASTSRDAVVVDVGGLDGFRVAATSGAAGGGAAATSGAAGGGAAARSGGAGAAALGSEAANGTVIAGPGLRNWELYRRLARRGLALPSGSCPNVALGGLATGGGMGLAGRALGLTLDRVTAFDVVTAAGERRRVGGDDDLFWALRGGGGSFAIVTAIHLRPRRLRRAAWFFASYPASARAEVLAAWDGLAPGAPPELTSICTLTASRVSAFGQFLGSERALRRLAAPLARIGGASFSAGTSGFLDLQRRWAGCADGGCGQVPRDSFDASSVYVARRLDAAGRRAFLAAADAGATLVLDAYGGAIADVEPDATAFVHRDVRFSVQILSYAPLATARRRVRRARSLIAPLGNGGAYQNYADLRLRSPRRAYYGSNYARLKRIKAAVDPDGRFRPAQGI